MIIVALMLAFMVAALPFVSMPAPARVSVLMHPYTAELIRWGQYRENAREEAEREFDRLYANVDPIKVAARIEFDRIARFH